MVPISAAVPRSQTRSTAASDSAGRSVVNRSVRPGRVHGRLGRVPGPDRLPTAPCVLCALADRATGPSRVVRRARNSIGIAAKMISAEMTMMA